MALAATAMAKTDQQKCQHKNGHAVQAIQRFCQKTDMVIPSDYARNGAHVGTGGPHDTRVHIDGSCNPWQWVPQKYCLSQLYNMCAQGDGAGSYGARFYGNNNCQTWVLNVGRT
ncbi:hypothetical protein LTS10_011306 [Elasticomyces elasticus]|nr:hypothetical protein LTR27_001591 [Elasticomyces elasticus]KAK5676017.1 hypothetical protein LTS10_011306 [Elasticomyces elasticus]